MLAKPYRVKSGQDFARVLSAGVRSGTAHLVVYLKVRQAGPARVGLIVSKKVGNAVTRNQVKRRLRHVAAAELPTLSPQADIVIRALSPASFADYAAELHTALAGCKRKLGR
ncbi:MAG: ribonuclease P protein component [Propionibacteriaceae bacterium]|nr:ribonuclease P protein component [Propionibacteriaceae bacterium]